MGLFKAQQKQQEDPVAKANDDVRQYFEDYFQELRNRGHLYFEEILEERKVFFKQDLDATVSQAQTDLKEHLAGQLNKLFAENDKLMHEARESAKQMLQKSTAELQSQHQKLSQELRDNIAKQQADITAVIDQNKNQLAATNQAQDEAVRSLNESAQALDKQGQLLSQALQQNAVRQQQALVSAFEGNMVQIVEHYLLGALGEEFDLKAQLPSIIKQLEANKQAIVDDMQA